MTVTYSGQVAHRQVGMFGRLLFNFKGSVWKLIYKDILLYWICYFALFSAYKYGFTLDQRRTFDEVCKFFSQLINFLPMTFILGFYVSLVVTRWWQMYVALAWPDSCINKMVVYISGLDDRSRLIRRTVVRWMSLSNVLVLRSVSAAVRKRFPSLDNVVSSGFMTEAELVEFNKNEYPSHHYWVPIKWCIELMGRARLEGRLLNDRFLVELVQEITNYREKVSTLLDYDWISIPLVYTQVVAMAAYSFYFAQLFATQPGAFTPSTKVGGTPVVMTDKVILNYDSYEIILPLLGSTIQLLFFMGLLKVGECLLNPLGLGDDDFELNWIITRNLKHSYMVVDELFDVFPKMERDLFWGQECIVPTTKAAVGVKDKAQKQSMQGVKLKPADAEMFNPDEAKKSTFFGKIAGTFGFGSGNKDVSSEEGKAEPPTKSMHLSVSQDQSSNESEERSPWSPVHHKVTPPTPGTAATGSPVNTVIQPVFLPPVMIQEGQLIPIAPSDPAGQLLLTTHTPAPPAPAVYVSPQVATPVPAESATVTYVHAAVTPTVYPVDAPTVYETPQVATYVPQEVPTVHEPPEVATTAYVPAEAKTTLFPVDAPTVYETPQVTTHEAPVPTHVPAEVPARVVPEEVATLYVAQEAPSTVTAQVATAYTPAEVEYAPELPPKPAAPTPTTFAVETPVAHVTTDISKELVGPVSTAYVPLPSATPTEGTPQAEAVAGTSYAVEMPPKSLVRRSRSLREGPGSARSVASKKKQFKSPSAKSVRTKKDKGKDKGKDNCKTQ